MPQQRKIRKIFKSRPTIEGAGVHLKRVFGFNQVPELDPFLLMDDFHSGNPADYLSGFPWHPHRGIETITYVLYGDVEHGDSLGNSGVINSGDVQWMTAGSGIIHQEMPKGDANHMMWGFQLWANLPARQKMMAPRYREVKQKEIPEVTLKNGAIIKIISGTVNGVAGPVRDIVIEPQYLDISMPANSQLELPIKAGHTAIAYVIEGAAYFDSQRDCFSFEVAGRNYFDLERDCLIPQENLVLYGDGDTVKIEGGTTGVRFLLISGKPLNEPVAWYGPIVMNSQEELRVAFDEYRNGTFIKHQV